MSLRELDQPSLDAALAYLDLLAEQKPEKLERAAVRWHARLETETPMLALAESQLALAALASLCAGERDATEVLRRLLRRARPKDHTRVEPGKAV
jgi:NADPH-dependent ferric siderophore reductase